MAFLEKIMSNIRKRFLEKSIPEKHTGKVNQTLEANEDALNISESMIDVTIHNYILDTEQFTDNLTTKKGIISLKSQTNENYKDDKCTVVALSDLNNDSMNNIERDEDIVHINHLLSPQTEILVSSQGENNIKDLSSVILVAHTEIPEDINKADISRPVQTNYIIPKISQENANENNIAKMSPVSIKNTEKLNLNINENVISRNVSDKLVNVKTFAILENAQSDKSSMENISITHSLKHSENISMEHTEKNIPGLNNVNSKTKTVAIIEKIQADENNNKNMEYNRNDHIEKDISAPVVIANVLKSPEAFVSTKNFQDISEDKSSIKNIFDDFHVTIAIEYSSTSTTLIDSDISRAFVNDKTECALEESLDDIVLDTFSDNEEINNNSIFLENVKNKVEFANKTDDSNDNKIIDLISNSIKDTVTNIDMNIADEQSYEIKLDDFEDFFSDNETEHTNVTDSENLEKLVMGHRASIKCVNEYQYDHKLKTKAVLLHENSERKDKNIVEIVKKCNLNNEIICISSEDELEDLKLPLHIIETISISSIETNNELSDPYQDKTDDKLETYLETESRAHTAGGVERIENIDKASNEISEAYKVGHTLNADEDSCSGYNSSDFEFITEEESLKDSFIINFKPKTVTGNETSRTLEITKETISETSNRSRFDSAIAGPSNNRKLFNRQNFRNNYQQYHVMPAGNDYYNLFQDIYSPLPLNMLENKSTNGSTMHVEYQGIGFDIKVLDKQLKECDSDSEYQEEARQNALKIMQKYPRENRKRRRRY